MKILNYIVLSLLVVSAWVGCSKDESIGFDIDNYAALEERHLDVRVRSNVDFDVKIPDDVASWVRTEDYALTLDRGLRPREVTVRFNWGINSVPQERIAEIEFVPKEESGVSSDRYACA